MKHGSYWSVFLSAASYCIWQVEISYPTSLPRNPIDQYPSKFHCVFFILNFTIANSYQKKVLFQTQYQMRCHLCTERTTRDQERCPGGHPTKPEPRQILLHLQQLVFWSKEKNLSISMSYNSIAKQLLLRSSWGGVSNAFSKSNMNVSTCPLLSRILAQSFITVVNWVSQLCPFLNACCLSVSVYSSRWVMIFEHTMCSSNLQGTQVKETGR